VLSGGGADGCENDKGPVVNGVCSVGEELPGGEMARGSFSTTQELWFTGLCLRWREQMNEFNGGGGSPDATKLFLLRSVMGS
jgi:hypothetical protein